MAIFNSGTSNIELIEKNKAAFPPEFRSASRLTYYSSLFNSVEINSTFYKLPLPATLERWVTEVPENFNFTLKLWRNITHNKNLAFDRGDLEKFMRIAAHIGLKKGALLVQLPAGTRPADFDQLAALLEEIKKYNPGNAWKIAVEFRHESWYDDRTYSLLCNHAAALVWHDRPLMMDLDKMGEREPFIYLRFHGPNGGNYKGSYNDGFLRDQAARIRGWLTQGKDVYAYFNNTAAGDAPKDLLTLNSMLAPISRLR